MVGSRTDYPLLLSEFDDDPATYAADEAKRLIEEHELSPGDWAQDRIIQLVGLDWLDDDEALLARLLTPHHREKVIARLTTALEEDHDLYQHNWECYLSCVGDLLKERWCEWGWRVAAYGMGWQRLSGKGAFMLPDREAEWGATLCHFVLPSRGGGSLRMYGPNVHPEKPSQGAGFPFNINTAHHDSPTWGVEWYYFTPRTEEQYEHDNR